MIDFISLEPYQVSGLRYVGDILEKQHIIRVVGAAKHFAFRDAGRRAILLVAVVARLPCVEVLDLEVESQVFIIHWYSPL